MRNPEKVQSDKRDSYIVPTLSITLLNIHAILVICLFEPRFDDFDQILSLA